MKTIIILFHTNIAHMDGKRGETIEGLGSLILLVEGGNPDERI
jgi:hypothetical protein